MDPMTISLIASAVLGMAKNNEQQREFKTNMEAQAAKEKFGGFTGEKGEVQQRPSQVDPMFQSLIAGAMMGQSLKKAGYGPAADGGDGSTIVAGSKGDPNSPSFVGPPNGLAGQMPTSADAPGANVGAIGSQSAIASSPYARAQRGNGAYSGMY